jgi:hypothetical protein
VLVSQTWTKASSVAQATKTIIRDDVAPTVTITEPADGATLTRLDDVDQNPDNGVQANVEVQVDGVDDAEGATACLSNNGVLLAPCPDAPVPVLGGFVTFPATSLVSGANLLHAAVTDGAGNVGAGEATVLLDVDAPSVDILPVGQGNCLASGDRVQVTVQTSAGDGAQAALARARELAPNYARVRWAYGNLLLRNGETNAAFDEMRAAASADPAFAPPLVFAASQFFDGDAVSVKNAVGNSPAALASLSLTFANEKRFEDAVRIWQSLDHDQMSASAEIGKTVLTKILDAKNYSAALALANLLGDSPKYAVRTVYDGGFENGITMSNSGPFDWRIPDGQQPQVALTDGQRHGGSYSLLLIFRASAGSDVRPISQTVAVVPGAAYRFESFYRSDLKTAAKIRWQITAGDGRMLASTEAMAPSQEFAQLKCDFVVPPEIDGVTVNLVRDACTGPCPIAGNLWLDDISLETRR